MKKVLLCILDGVGLSDNVNGNAVKNANKPFLDKLMQEYPHSKVTASGELVGLPEGQMGNSEVGHLNIGAGRIVFQPEGLINNKIKDGSFYLNEAFLEVINHVKKNNSKLHLMALLSDGGVHSVTEHLFALLDLCKKEELDKVYLHVFMDGRDTSPYDGEKYLLSLNKKLLEIGIGKIASLSGRYYAMDRDNNYERIKLAYEAMTSGVGEEYNSALEAWQENQRRGITDEFMVPAVISKEGMIASGDGMIWANYRADRMRELGSALTNPNFKGFDRKIVLDDVKLATLMIVSDEVICKNAFQLDTLNNTLGEYVSNKGLTQLRIAETEKYAHVTYFFDGGLEKDLAGAKRILIPSPKVATYDLAPEMSAKEITMNLISEIKTSKPDMIILNYANGDMVGHTGNYDAAIKAVETLDREVKKLISNINLNEYTVLVTADHGNCEVMINKDGSVNTQHSTNLVPFIVLDKDLAVRDGKLADIAPTILDIMGLEVPAEMTGKSLIVRN